MLSSTPGYHAVPRELVYPVYYPAISAQLYCLLRPLIQAATANIGPAAAKERIEAAKQRRYPPA